MIRSAKLIANILTGKFPVPIYIHRHTDEGSRVKAASRPNSDPFLVIPAKAGIEGFHAVALGPRFRGDDEIDCVAEFSHSLEGRYPWQQWVPAFVGTTKSWTISIGTTLGSSK